MDEKKRYDCFRIENSFGYPLAWTAEHHQAKVIADSLNATENSLLKPYVVQQLDHDVMESIMKASEAAIREYMVDKIDKYMEIQSYLELSKKSALEIFDEATDAGNI